MSMPDFPVQGGCVCRSVRYELTAPPLAVYNCHCKDCQRFSGAGWSMSMPVNAESLNILDGSVVHYDKPADSGRVVRMFACAECGTKLWNEPLSSPEMLVVRAGTLDDLAWVRPVGNIWTASRAHWVEIDPHLVNFDGQPPSRDPLYAAWQRQMAAQS
ncbi:aldehyde-activating protein [Devosia pacifica]|uniref:Aldehyde-activating protein n=1 Tax=Devosia pacifica TaxID=1335967 RepID=A0A918RXR5_9HYPH|nr:GFA family protein [Devosia pacifica]GHA15598.1 aldehyde-activating protein [Devosia pacifica]